MERETGIEPALVAWKATVLPLNYSRFFRDPGDRPRDFSGSTVRLKLVEGGGLLRASCPPPLRGRTASRRVPDRSGRSGRTTPVVLTHLRNPVFIFETGGGRWIRTTEGVSQQIYSLPPLAAWVSLRISFTHRVRRLPQRFSSRASSQTLSFGASRALSFHDADSVKAPQAQKCVANAILNPAPDCAPENGSLRRPSTRKAAGCARRNPRDGDPRRSPVSTAEPALACRPARRARRR